MNEISFVNSSHTTLLSVDLPPLGMNGFCDMSFFDQPELELCLRRLIVERDGIEVRLGHEVRSVDQDDEGVTIRSEMLASGETIETRARFTIGCDGASSFVRECMGIGWESLDYDQDWLVLDILQGPEADLPEVTIGVPRLHLHS